jgi:tetratricopeptide (TPR) repeat protein
MIPAVRLRSAIPAALAAAFLAATGAARVALEPEASDAGEIRNPAWLPDGKLLRIGAFGHRHLLSDVYWLRLVQYVGAQVLSRQGDWAALHPLADLVTDLDPRHGYAYQIAGSNLSGLAHRYGEAEAILKKGMEALPDRWSLPFTHAVNKFFYEEDFAEAARYARRAAEVGKRPHLALLAANLSLVADADGEYAVAAAFLEESLRQVDTPELRGQLEARLVKVRTYAALSAVEKAAASFERRTGHRPLTLLDLVAGGELREIPADPSGGTIIYDPSTGKARSSVLGERTPVRKTFSQELPHR